MYDLKSNLVIGFHGCEATVRDELLLQPSKIKFSQQPFDWLGHGLYFWENNYERAMQWAIHKKHRGRIRQPAVIGAVLQLGYCCDFLDSKYINLLSYYFESMSGIYNVAGISLPENKDISKDPYKNKLLRYLDCAVIEFMHLQINQGTGDVTETGKLRKLTAFDSVRGAFLEGGPAFEGSGIFSKTHIQICIRNPNCIKGFFMPRKEINFTGKLKMPGPL